MRRYSSSYLCDLSVEKIGVQCQKCGLTKRYDRLTLIRRLENFDDQCMPSLLRILATAEGCERAGAPNFGDPCQLVYDEATRKPPAS